MMMTDGETVLWEQLEAKNSNSICRRAGARYDPKSGIYILTCFDEIIQIKPKEKRVEAVTDRGAGSAGSDIIVPDIVGPDIVDPDIVGLLLSDQRDQFVPALLAYLVYAEGNAVTGELIAPRDLSGGQIYRQGAHQLPLDRLASKYRHDEKQLLERVRKLGGHVLDYGDYSFRLFPFPKLPVTLVLWKEDEEFPSRADFFFDTSCRGQFPPDVLWGIASFCVELLLI
jgi:hypothetical protein